MTIHIFKSTDVGRTGISGEDGSLVALFDDLLVTEMSWTKEYSGTNKAAYKQPAGSNGFYLQVLDDQGANSKYAKVRGCETMSDVDTGTDFFPTVADEADFYWHKSNSNDSTLRDWVFYSNGVIFYMIVNNGSAYHTGFSFGDCTTIIPGDDWFTIITGTDASSNSSSGLFVDNNTTRQARSFDGTTKSTNNYYDGLVGNLGNSGNTGELYPTNPSEKLNLHPITFVTDTTATSSFSSSELRGYMSGLFYISTDLLNLVANVAEVPSDSFSDQNGITYDLISVRSNANDDFWAIQTSGEWL